MQLMLDGYRHLEALRRRRAFVASRQWRLPRWMSRRRAGRWERFVSKVELLKGKVGLWNR